MDECYPCYNQDENNSSGFSAVPAGYYDTDSDDVEDDAYSAYFWTCTSDDDTSEHFAVNPSGVKITWSDYKKSYFLSVRCVKDE